MGREPMVWVLTLHNTPKVASFLRAFPWRVTSQGGPGCWQHRQDLCVVRFFHDLFLQVFFWFCFLVILWSIYTNIKVLFIDLGHTAVLRGVGQPGDGRIPIDGCPFSPE